MKKTKEMSICALFAALICAGAFMKLPTPLPITLQTLFTCLAGLVLGGKKGSVAVGVYIFIGLIGLPVFAEGGGLSYVLKPSFGYILGFLPATFITGKIAEKQIKFRRFIFASFVGMVIIYIIGLAYYFLISRYYLKNQLDVVWLIIYGFIMTLPGDILMCILSTSLGVKLKKTIKF
ncbi:MAG: biotin transporter BioY [Ruminococcaceae bacterium]|nr:biotin transporter BioY [Oscillospiraceae bacterium]